MEGREGVPVGKEGGKDAGAVIAKYLHEMKDEGYQRYMSGETNWAI